VAAATAAAAAVCAKASAAHAAAAGSSVVATPAAMAAHVACKMTPFGVLATVTAPMAVPPAPPAFAGPMLTLAAAPSAEAVEGAEPDETMTPRRQRSEPTWKEVSSPKRRAASSSAGEPDACQAPVDLTHEDLLLSTTLGGDLPSFDSSALASWQPAEATGDEAPMFRSLSAVDDFDPEGSIANSAAATADAAMETEARHAAMDPWQPVARQAMVVATQGEMIRAELRQQQDLLQQLEQLKQHGLKQHAQQQQADVQQCDAMAM